MRVQEDTHRSGLGKRPYGSLEPRKYEAGSSSGPSKRMAFERTLIVPLAKVRVVLLSAGLVLVGS